MIRTANLQCAVEALVELNEVNGLQHHVAELEHGEWLLCLKAGADAVEGHHTVDGEVRTEVSQEFEEAEFVQPLSVVDDLALPFRQIEEAFYGCADTCEIVLNLRIIQQRTAFTAETWITNAGGTTAHQQDWFVTGFLQPAHGH